MEKKNNIWHKLLGFDPNPELKRMILDESNREGKTLAEVCGRYAMPPVYVGDEPDDDYENDFRPAIRIREDEL